jgi:phosphatidylethanolamine/phosphatidyl-N-methylethanolamine N-methyltransferase
MPTSGSLHILIEHACRMLTLPATFLSAITVTRLNELSALQWSYDKFNNSQLNHPQLNQPQLNQLMKPISIDNVVTTYRFYAPLYDRIFGAVLEPGRQALTQAVRAVRPSSILEVGVGTGLTLSQYPPSSAIVGIDVSTAMLEIAQERAKKLAERDIQLFAMDAEAMEFPDNSFDCVAIPYVLSVTPDPKRLIAEIRRVCRKNGTILILNHFSGSRFWWFLEQAVQSLANRIGFRSDFCFDEQILKHDWEVQSVRKVNFLGLSRLVTIRNT